MDKKQDNPFEEILKEFSNPNTFTSPKNGTSWESSMIRWPHGATSNSGSHESNFFNRAKEEEEGAKAPPIKPYPLNFINDGIVDLHAHLHNLKVSIKAAAKYPNMGRDDLRILQEEMKRLNKMIDNVEKMFYNIEKITL